MLGGSGRAHGTEVGERARVAVLGEGARCVGLAGRGVRERAERRFGLLRFPTSFGKLNISLESLPNSNVPHEEEMML